MAISPTSSDLAGQLLLAEPSLRERTFHRSVILLAEHSADDGAFGLVLNHPTGQKVGDLLPGPEFQGLADIPVHLGGPVSRGHMIFGAFWERQDQFGFAVRISAEEAEAYDNAPGTLVKAFVGYTGWSKDQLEEEIANHAWFPQNPKPSILKKKHDVTLWRQLLSKISPYHRLLAETPEELLAN